MDILKSISQSLEQENTEVQSIIEAVIAEVKNSPVSRIGLLNEDSHENSQLRKGDLILDYHQQLAYTFSGQYSNDGKPIVFDSDEEKGQRVLEPEFIIDAHVVANPSIKKAAVRLAEKYPNRKVFTYGELPAKLHEGKDNSTTSCGSKSEKMNDKQPWCTWMAASNKKMEKGLKLAPSAPNSIVKKILARRKGKK